MRKLSVFIAFLLFAGILSIAASRADEIKNKDVGYKVKLPDDWEIVDQDLLDKLLKQVASDQANIKFVAGYQPKGHKGLEYPYALVQEIPYPEQKSITEAELKSMVHEITGIKDQDIRKYLSDEGAALLGEVGEKKAAYTTDPVGFTMDLTAEVTGIGKIHDHAVGLLGKKHLLIIHIYTLAADAKKWKDAVSALASSFAMDADKALTLKAETK